MVIENFIGTKLMSKEIIVEELNKKFDIFIGTKKFSQQSKIIRVHHKWKRMLVIG